MNTDKNSLMFPFITSTENPLGGDCYGCSYCYIHGPKGMKIRFKKIRNKYSGDIKLYSDILDKRFHEKDIIFLCSCIDIFNERVKSSTIRIIFEWINKSKHAHFLLLTKNPRRYFDFTNELPYNVILGCTIESNINHPDISKAPLQEERIRAMIDIANDTRIYHLPRLISIEPILKFSNAPSFGFNIKMMIPRIVVVGYDNHKNRLDEPSKANTELLIKYLREIRYNHSPKPEIILKSIRKAWWEK